MPAGDHLTDPQIEQLVGRYAREMARYESAALFVEQRLRRALRAAAIPAQLSSRPKHPEDLRDKLRKKRADPRYALSLLREDLSLAVTDLAGCRVMVYHPADEGKVAHLVRRAFRRAPREDADEVHHKPSGYKATHLLVSIAEEEECLALHGAICEIQVTTIAAHLFNELEHEIRYKDPSGPREPLVMSRLAEARGAIEGIERMVERLLDEHAEAVRRTSAPLTSALHLRTTLERLCDRPLRGDFARLFRLLEARVLPLTPASVSALGEMDALLEQGAARAAELGEGEPTEVRCLELSLASMIGVEVVPEANRKVGVTGRERDTSEARLKLEEVAEGLSRLGERALSIHVFADDVQELYALQRREPPRTLTAQGDEGRRFRYQSLAGGVYLLEVLPGGVARLSLSPDPSVGEAPSSARSRAIGAAIGAAAWTKGEEWTGPLLGLLVGPKLGSSEAEDAPRLVFTLRFDPGTRRWEAYEGGLLRWMKQELSAPGLG